MKFFKKFMQKRFNQKYLGRIVKLKEPRSYIIDFYECALDSNGNLRYGANHFFQDLVKFCDSPIGDLCRKTDCSHKLFEEQVIEEEYMSIDKIEYVGGSVFNPRSWFATTTLLERDLEGLINLSFVIEHYDEVAPTV